MSIILNDNVYINAGKPSEAKYLTTSNTKYANIAAVNSAIALSLRYDGLTVKLADGKEYWYDGGVQDNNLVLKSSSATFTTQTKNFIFSAPSSSSGIPSFRLLTSSDIPSLNYLKLSGGTMGGAINMWNNRILSSTGINISVNNGVLWDINNKFAVQWNNRILADQAEQYSIDWQSRAMYDTLQKQSILWSGRLLRDNKEITSSNWNNRTLNSSSGATVVTWNNGHLVANYTPSGANDLITKSYADINYSGTNFLPLSGGIMTGDIDMGMNSIHSSGGGSINFTSSTLIDDGGAVSIFWSSRELTTNTNDIVANWGSGKIKILYTPTDLDDVVDKQYVDNATSSGNYLSLIGGIMTGDIIMSNSSYITQDPNNGLSSILLDSSYINDISGFLSIDWSNRSLYDNINNLSLDWGYREMYDSTNNLSLDWDNRSLYDNSGFQSLDWENRQMYDSTNNYVSLDWNNRYLYNSGGNISADWNSGILYDENNIKTIGWNDRFLYDSIGGNSIDWSNRFLIDISGNSTLNWSNRTLSDSASYTILDWQNKYLYEGTTLSLDWSGRNLNDSLGVGSLSWSTRRAYNGDGITTLNWNLEALYANDGSQSVDWSNRTFLDSTGNTVGNWDSKTLNDASGSTSVDWSNRILYDSTNVDILNWQNKTLNDSASSTSVDWENRTLSNSSNINVLDWQNKTLNDSVSSTSVDWENRTLVGQDTNTSIDWNLRTLNNYLNSTIADWSGDNLLLNGDPINDLEAATKQYVDNAIINNSSSSSLYLSLTGGIMGDSALISSANSFSIWVNQASLLNNLSLTTLQWNDCVLNNNSGVTTLSWQQQFLRCTDTTVAIDWENRNLIDIDNHVVVDWSNKYLYGEYGVISLDWTSRALYAPTSNSLDWRNKILFNDINDEVAHWSGSSFQILKNPIDPLDAVNKQYVDSIGSNGSNGTNFLKLDGSNSPNANIDWNDKQITNINQIQTSSLSSVYTVMKQDGIRCFNSGQKSTMTGSGLVMFGDTTNDYLTQYISGGIIITDPSYNYSAYFPTYKSGAQTFAMLSDIGGAIPSTTFTVNTTVTTTYGYYYSNNSTTLTLTLLDATTCLDFEVLIKNINTGVLTINTILSQTIDGITSRSITSQYGFIKLKSDGSNWLIIG